MAIKVGGTTVIDNSRNLSNIASVDSTTASAISGEISIDNDNWSGTDLSVANGGTGALSFTANNVLLGNGTSSFLEVAPGTTGNVLTSNGTTWTSAAASAGALEYISSGTASNSANLTFTLPSGYDGFLFLFTAIKPATDGTQLRATTSISNHRWAYVVNGTSVVQGAGNNSDSNGATLTGAVGNAASEQGVSGVLNIGADYASSTLQTSGVHKFVYLDSGGNMTNLTGSFQTTAAATDTSLVFKFSTGNISSGTITMYGYVAS